MWKTEIRKSSRSATLPKPSLSIGENLAALRKDRGMTLKAAAAVCSVSAPTLSRIENGTLSPTFNVIASICAGFGVGISEFLSYSSKQKVSGWRTVTRLGTGRTIETPQYRFEFLCDDMIRKPFIVLRAEILMKSIEEFGPLQSHSGQEQIVVQSGRVEIWTEHYAPAVLETGDSLAFDSALGHAVISLSEEPATVLWICDSLEAEI